MRRSGKVAGIDSIIKPPLGASEPYRYRNKMTFTCSTSRDSVKNGNQDKLSETPTVGMALVADNALLHTECQHRNAC